MVFEWWFDGLMMVYEWFNTDGLIMVWWVNWWVLHIYEWLILMLVLRVPKSPMFTNTIRDHPWLDWMITGLPSIFSDTDWSFFVSHGFQRRCKYAIKSSWDNYLLVMTNIAMENPKNKWRFLAGKIIYKWAIYTMAMLIYQRVNNDWTGIIN